MSHKCPVCSTEAKTQYKTSPYWVCNYCDCWFQDPKPPKVYEADHEKTNTGDFAGHLMSDHEKSINDQIANWLFKTYLGATPKKTLDIGSKYPYLAHCFKKRGCDSYGMDNIEIVPEYSKELDVPMLMADFEQITDDQIKEWTKTDKFDLISMVHVFEHMYEPKEALRKLRRLLADDGTLYLRLPDHSVPGFERDLTDGHYTIHPFFHSFTSILELLVQTQDLFTVIGTTSPPTNGQRDIVLKPLLKKPTVWAGLIVKNEERDLPRALKSIESVVDGVVIVDTGSTDNTKYVATHTIKKPVDFSVYTGASKQDETGDWKLWDFGKARNEFIKQIEAKTNADYVLWFDADDQLLTPASLRRVLYWSQYSVFGVQIKAGHDYWVHHRLWKNHLGIHFQGRCHEYPTYGGFPTVNLQDTVIEHHAEPGAGESSNARNLRILDAEFKEEPTPRCAFYLGNTHKDGGRWLDAIPAYDARIKMGEHYRDEWLFAYLYKARCERASNQLDAAKRTLLEALSKQDDWSEFWMELAYIANDESKWWDAIGYATLASAKQPPWTALWRERNKYSDQPMRIISWAYEHLGMKDRSVEYAYKAKIAIGAPDQDWDNRITRLTTNHYAVCRPGAIGDVIMTLNIIPEFKESLPAGSVLHYFCHPSIGEQLGPLLIAAGVDLVEDSSTFNARSKEFVKAINLVGYPLIEGYPDKPMKKHLLEYFAKEMGITADPTDLPSIVFQKPTPVHKGEYLTLHAKAGWSAYKQWDDSKWAEVITRLNKPVVQIGTSSDPKIPGAIHDYMGTPLVTAINLIANAQLHLGVDSFSNHVTNFTWMGENEVADKTPAVILWGSTQPSAAGYEHNKNLNLGLFCQPCFREDPAISQAPRGPCINPPGQVYEAPNHACMKGITVDMVVEAANELLK
jgi:ADP-heptose:LPS heptosyltransferase/SAM-dependent methyltransferase